MKIGLLQPDPIACDLAQQAIAQGHTVSRIVDGGPAAEKATEFAPQATLDSNWQQLIGSDVDAVIVGRLAADEGRQVDQRVEQLRGLVLAAVPLIVVHPACPMIPGFELQMIQRDTDSVLIPYFPGCDHPGVAQLADWNLQPDRSPIGRIEQFQFQRSLPEREKRPVLEQFSRDAYLLRNVLQVVHRVGGSLAEKRTSDFSNLAVHMTGEDAVVARWSVTHGEARRAEWTAIGSAGTRSLLMPDDPAHWSLKENDAESGVTGERGEVPWKDWQPGLPTLQLLEAVVSDQSKDHSKAACDQASRLWDHACRAEEMADTVEVSCRKGKTLDLYQQQHTEEDTFKTLMAAGGCAALLLCLLCLLLFALFDSLQLDAFSGPVWERWPLKAIHPRAWPLYVLSGLGVFLALQALKIVFPKPK